MTLATHGDSAMNHNSNKQWIVDKLGGLDSILQFYLTNKNTGKKPSEEQLRSLKYILLSQEGLNINDDSNLHFELKSSNFREHKTALSINASHNLYFKLLNPAIASFLYYNIILNKYYAIGMQSLYFLLVIVSRLAYHLFLVDLFVISGWICLTVSLVFSLSYLLSINLDIFKHVLKTFDFWFLLYNYVTFIIGGHFPV